MEEVIATVGSASAIYRPMGASTDLTASATTSPACDTKACSVEIMGTVTVANVSAGKAGQASTATVQPAGTHVHLRMEYCAVDVGTASVASVSAGTLEPRDPPVNAVPPVVTLVTLSGAASNATCLQMARTKSAWRSANPLVPPSARKIFQRILLFPALYKEKMNVLLHS